MDAGRFPHATETAVITLPDESTMVPTKAPNRLSSQGDRDLVPLWLTTWARHSSPWSYPNGVANDRAWLRLIP